VAVKHRRYGDELVRVNRSLLLFGAARILRFSTTRRAAERRVVAIMVSIDGRRSVMLRKTQKRGAHMCARQRAYSARLAAAKKAASQQTLSGMKNGGEEK